MFKRYAVYYTVPDSPLAEFGAAWLGWDLVRGAAVEFPKICGIDIAEITKTPHKYGFHGTIKPPFVLANGASEADLANALGGLCNNVSTVELEHLTLMTLGRFLALCPVGDTQPLNDLAAKVVRDLDIFRAPMSADDLARRRSSGLTSAQETNLLKWGYPHVMDAYKFHITLTGKLDKQILSKVQKTLDPIIAPLLPKPFIIDSLTLVGQREDGMFEQIRRYPLAP